MPFLSDRNGYAIPVLKFGATETVAATIASAQSTADSTKDRVIRMISDIDFYAKQGSNPTAASTDSALVPAGVEAIVVVPKGEVVAVLRVGAADGTVWFTELV